MKLFITIDCEEDDWGIYSTSLNRVENITNIHILQKMFDRYGAIPTYLLNYPVVTNDNAMEIFLGIYKNGNCEIGSHCHPWNTPPFDEELSDKNSMMCNLPYPLLMAKIQNLHSQISEATGSPPVCFRAGRWGFGPEVAKCLSQLGYKVDTSVTPLVNWNDISGPDFSGAPLDIYRFDPDDLLREKPGGRLLEVPPTIGFFQNNLERSARLRRFLFQSSLSKFRIIGVLDRLKILNFCWLSPETNTGKQMITLAKNYIGKGYKYLNMSFHSTSLLPGKGPFVKNSKDLREFLSRIEMFLEFSDENNIEFSPLCEAEELCKQST